MTRSPTPQEGKAGGGEDDEAVAGGEAVAGEDEANGLDAAGPATVNADGRPDRDDVVGKVVDGRDTNRAAKGAADRVGGGGIEERAGREVGEAGGVVLRQVDGQLFDDDRAIAAIIEVAVEGHGKPRDRCRAPGPMRRGRCRGLGTDRGR